MENLEPLGIAFTLAFLSEAITEYLFARLAGEKFRNFLPYVSALVGVALCLAYRVDIIAPLVDLPSDLPALGQVLSGLLLGRGSNFLHDFASSYLRKRGKM